MRVDGTGIACDDVADGQARLAYTIKRLLDRAAPHVFELLDINDDSIFLEPLLFAFFNAKSPPTSLEQILFGYIANELKPRSINVMTDSDGAIHLPGLGYIRTGMPIQSLEIEWCGSATSLKLRRDRALVPFTLDKTTLIPDTQISLAASRDELLRELYTDAEGNYRKIEVLHSQALAERVGRAIHILRESCPEYYGYLSAVARHIILFRAPEIRPFATIAAHGTAFISSHEDPSVPFLAVELVHQFGHNILNAVLRDARVMFAVDPQTRLQGYVDDESDERTVLSAFHGLYTTTQVAHCTSSMLASPDLSAVERHELVARLADNRDRVYSGIESAVDDVLTARGRVLYSTMIATCHRIYKAHEHELRGLDTSNQPFVFDYELFCRTNPSPCHAIA